MTPAGVWGEFARKLIAKRARAPHYESSRSDTAFAFTAARFMLTQDYRRQKSDDKNSGKLYEYRTYRRCGIMMMFLNLTIGGMSVQMIRCEESH